MAYLNKYNTFQHVSRAVASGMFKKPVWFDAAKVTPPMSLAEGDKPRVLHFPEEKLHRRLMRLKPMLALEVYTKDAKDHGLGTKFAQQQWRYMEFDGMSEEEAFLKCDEIFKSDLADYEKRMVQFRGHTEFVRASGMYEVLNKRSEQMQARERSLKEHLKNLRKMYNDAKGFGAQGVGEAEKDDLSIKETTVEEFESGLSAEDYETTQQLRDEHIKEAQGHNFSRGATRLNESILAEPMKQMKGMRTPYRLDRVEIVDPYQDLNERLPIQLASRAQKWPTYKKLDLEVEWMGKVVDQAKEETEAWKEMMKEKHGSKFTSQL